MIHRLIRRKFTGDMLKVFRNFRGMTQVELSEASGLGQGSIAKIENGQSFPQAETITALSESLDVHSDWFYPEAYGLE